MSKIYFQIPYPTFIESLIVYFLLRYRKKHYGYPFRLIKLIQSDKYAKPIYAKVDAGDYHKLSRFNWNLEESKSNGCYAVRHEHGKYISMHRVIMNAPKGSIVDHKDHDGLNNTKANLRFATHSQNVCNTIRIKKNATSKYRGVRKARENKFQAYIQFQGKFIHLGTFENEEDAARAYDEAAKKYYGEFAVLNFPNDAQIKIIT